jgi:hypothetical protein
MPLRNLACALLGLVALPAAAAVGPIEFGLGAGNLTYTNPNPGADQALVPIQHPGAIYTIDPADGAPVVVSVLEYLPQRLLGVPAWATALPDGTYRWDVNGYFGIPIALTGFTAGRPGQFGTVTFYGQAHMIAAGSPSAGWTGSAALSVQGSKQVWLDGYKFTISGASASTPGRAAVSVSVDPTLTPEPGTLALVALGLLPLGLRARRHIR